MKKAIAVICSLVLALGVLSACKNTPTDNTTENTSKTSDSSSVKSSESTAPEKTSSKADEKNSTEKSTQSESTTEVKAEKKAFPSFETEDIFGAKVSQKVFQENKLTLVHIILTDCDSNAQELPELAKLDKELQNIGFLGIVLDINEGDGVDESALRAAKKLCTSSDTDYPFLITNDSLIEFCKSFITIPATYFVDKDGNIVGDPVFGANDAKTWKEIIDQKLSVL